MPRGLEPWTVHDFPEELRWELQVTEQQLLFSDCALEFDRNSHLARVVRVGGSAAEHGVEVNDLLLSAQWLPQDAPHHVRSHQPIFSLPASTTDCHAALRNHLRQDKDETILCLVFVKLLERPLLALFPWSGEYEGKVMVRHFCGMSSCMRVCLLKKITVGRVLCCDYVHAGGDARRVPRGECKTAVAACFVARECLVHRWAAGKLL